MFTDRSAAAPARRAARQQAPTPYGFERDLAPRQDAAGKALPSAEQEAAVAAARQEGYDAGRAAGRREADAELAAATLRLALTAERMIADADAALAVLRQEAVAVAVTAAGRLAFHLVEREPLGEIEALLTDCLGPLHDVPHLSVRLREADADNLRQRIAPLAEKHRFAGRLTVIGEPRLGPGDCRIEWSGGSIVRDLAGAADILGAALQQRFPARPLAALAPPAGDGASPTGEES